MITVATWNINSIRARINCLQEWLAQKKPDVVLLQEIKCQKDQFPFSQLSSFNYNYEIVGQKSYNGVAILSKYPIEDVQYCLPTFADDQQARYIEALINGTRVISVYAPNGNEYASQKFNYKLQFYDLLTLHIKNLLKYEENLIIGGDYNIAPYFEDGYNAQRFREEKILCSLIERNKFRQLLNLGLIDCLRQKYPIHAKEEYKNLFSWWDYRSGAFDKNAGYRIDSLLLSPQAMDKYHDCGIDSYVRSDAKPSDHAPVWLTMDT